VSSLPSPPVWETTRRRPCGRRRVAARRGVPQGGVRAANITYKDIQEQSGRWIQQRVIFATADQISLGIMGHRTSILVPTGKGEVDEMQQ
jgi:hypothetical protein